VLKCAYGRLIKSKMRVRINYINKLGFLEAYPSARIEVFESEIIKSSFVAAGLILYNSIE
jgi:hypothetical protein